MQKVTKSLLVLYVIASLGHSSIAWAQGCDDPQACNNGDQIEECYYCSYGLICKPGGGCCDDLDENGVCGDQRYYGCTNTKACNYDSQATIDDGSCKICGDGYSCTPVGGCCYDPDENGICGDERIAGCMDPQACNYDPQAQVQAGNCHYCEDNTSCVDGLCCYDPDQNGICGSQVVEKPIIKQEVIHQVALSRAGCTNRRAKNFDTRAVVDDGSCEYDVTVSDHEVYLSDTSLAEDLYEQGIVSHIDNTLESSDHKVRVVFPDATSLDGRKQKYPDINTEAIVYYDIPDKLPPQKKDEIAQQYETISFDAQKVQQATTNDEYVSLQRYLSDMSFDTMYETCNYTGEKVTLAILDNAFDIHHPDIQDRISQVYDVADDDNDVAPPAQTQAWSHGTAAAGLAAAHTNNREGIASMAPSNMDLMLIKVTSDTATPDSITAGLEGLEYAASHGADIISMSRGTYASDDIPQLKNLITRLHKQYPNIIFISAAGNYNSTDPFYPAYYDNVFAVGSYDREHEKASFSNYGKRVQLMGPGVDMLTTDIVEPYRAYNGTSETTPFYAGIVATLISHGLSMDDIVNRYTTHYTDESIGTYMFDLHRGCPVQKNATVVENISINTKTGMREHSSPSMRIQSLYDKINKLAISTERKVALKVKVKNLLASTQDAGTTTSLEDIQEEFSHGSAPNLSWEGIIQRMKRGLHVIQSFVQSVMG